MNWGEWLQREYRVVLLFIVFLILLSVYAFRRYQAPDATQTAFLNNCTDLVLGALIGILSERWRNGK